ncbi:hypothetical protein [uncultured Maribacter sp.]|uniref:hypothetical protein n=1 Tax=uncultured Maribacter sp. TaxID=431308 RepID=UPI0030EF31C9|tara:strand:+ start:172758 stop:173054 length:297 start_codon:yes stop_codon:yes gene_type:complete
MEESLKVNKDYKEAFNLGYELAKELNLTTPMFKDTSYDNERINAMQVGMEQYSNEVAQGQHKENILHIESDKKTSDIQNMDVKKVDRKDFDKGLDFSR